MNDKASTQNLNNPSRNGEFMIAAALTDSTLSELQLPAALPTQHSTIPTDLRKWVGTVDLVSLILGAVQSIYWNDHDESESSAKSPGCHPQLILGLLVYCYAIGFYSVNEIARRLPADTALRYLSLNHRFPVRQLCLFRGQNRELLRHCLSRVLRIAWEKRYGKSNTCAIAGTKCQTAFRNRFDAEAAERINRAFQAGHYAVAAMHSGHLVPLMTQTRA